MSPSTEKSRAQGKLRLLACLLAIAATTAARAGTYTISTVAGSWLRRGGTNGGVTAPARFNTPTGVAVDASGNIFIADQLNNAIRKLTPGGVVSTFAAGITWPRCLAIDAGGTLYLGTNAPNRIYKITPAGMVSTYFQWSGNENDYGIGEVGGIAVNKSTGVVYLTDATRNSVMEVLADGTLDLVAGPESGTASGTTNGLGPAARFNDPRGLALDAAGNGYVCDSLNHTIRKITTNGTVSTFAGTAGVPGSADGTGTAAQFNTPTGIVVVPSGDIYVSDTGSHTLRKITPGGVVTTVAGTVGSASYGDGTLGANSLAPTFLNTPMYLAADAAGFVYVADSQNHGIRRVSPSGVTMQIAGQYPSGFVDGNAPVASFFFPVGVAVDANGALIVPGHLDRTLRKITPAGLVSALAGETFVPGSNDATGVAAHFTMPSGVTTDPAGNAYVADYGTHTIRMITPSGLVTTIAGTAGSAGSADGTRAVARFNQPTNIARDSSGNLYVSEAANHTVRKVAPDGNVTTLAGLAATPGFADGAGSAARFSAPAGMAISQDGVIYVADRNNHVIRRITPDGVVATQAGQAGVSGVADGNSAAARFLSPNGIAIDPAGNVIVADRGNHTLRQIAPNGDVTTVAGLAATTGFADGAGSTARFAQPAAVCFDANGTLYIADRDNNSIRKGVAPPWVMTQPVASSVYTSQPASFAVRVAGTGPFIYQWRKGGSPIAGATSATYSIAGATAGDAGAYTVVVTGAAGNVTSDAATLTVTTPATPMISTQPAAQAATAGGSVTLSIAATGAPGLTYQWKFNGVNIPGATGATYTLPSAQAFDAGTYTCVVTNITVSVTSTAASVTVNTAPASNARLMNLSTRALGLTGSDQLIPGFVLSGTGTKRMLVRGIGPGLHDVFGLNGVLPDPLMSLKNQATGAEVAANNDWGASVNKAQIVSTSATVGAFGLLDGSKDAAILVDLPAGAYTAPTVDSHGASGLAMVELYDADTAASTCQLVNISNRGFVDVGDKIMIPGFVVSAEGSRTFLIRAVGPGLNSTFGLTGVLADPVLTVFSGSTPILTNDNWDGVPGSANTAAVAATVGAFPLLAASKDSAFVVTLPPGGYTVQATGKGATIGVALVEVYLVP